MPKMEKSKGDLEALVGRAIADSIGADGVMLPFIEGHARDERGRNWDVIEPTPRHRKVVNAVRDEFDLQ